MHLDDPRAAPAKLAKAEAVYRDVFGVEHDKAVNGSAAVRLAFAKKLMGAAADVGGDAELKAVILNKALKIASATTGGAKTALEIHALFAADPKAKAEHAAELAALLERILVAEPASGKAKIAGDLVTAYGEAAAEQCRKGDVAAVKSLQRAKDVVRLYMATAPNSKELTQELDGKLKLVDKAIKENKELARLSDLLETDAKNIDAHVGLALIEYKNKQAKKAGERLLAVEVPAINRLGRAFAGGKETSPRELASAAFAATRAVTSATQKANLFDLARQSYEEAMALAEKFDPSLAREFMVFLSVQMASEGSGPGRSKTAERLIWLSIDVADEAMRSGDWDSVAEVLAEGRSACKGNGVVPATIAEFDAFEKDLRARLDMEREQAKHKETLKKTPNDPKANTGMALYLLAQGRTADAIPHLLKSERPEFAKMGEALKAAEGADLTRGDALRKMAGNLNGAEKAAFMNAARECFEAFVEKNPADPQAGRAKLLLSQLGPGPVRRIKRPSAWLPCSIRRSAKRWSNY